MQAGEHPGKCLDVHRIPVFPTRKAIAGVPSTMKMPSVGALRKLPLLGVVRLRLLWRDDIMNEPMVANSPWSVKAMPAPITPAHATDVKPPIARPATASTMPVAKVVMATLR